MNKKLTVAVAAAALSVSMAVPAMAQWNNLGNNNWQWLENGVAVKDQWVTTENGQYYINLDGLCSYNWINWNGNWYFGQQGSNLGNVVKNGWASVDGNYYYFGADGVMATGTQTINGVTYTFDANGHCTTTPTGVSYATYSTGAAASTSTTTVGGGSSSGGGSSTSMPAPSQKARDTQTALRDAEGDMNNVVSGVSVNVGVASGDTVNVQVNASGAVSAEDDATDLIGAALAVVGASGYEDQVKSIKVRTITADSVEELANRADAILEGLSVADAEKIYGSSRTVTVTLDNDVVINLFVQI